MISLPRTLSAALLFIKLWWIGLVFVARLAYHFMACLGIAASGCLWVIYAFSTQEELATAVPGLSLVVQAVIVFGIIIFGMRIAICGRLS